MIVLADMSEYHLLLAFGPPKCKPVVEVCQELGTHNSWRYVVSDSSPVGIFKNRPPNSTRG